MNKGELRILMVDDDEEDILLAERLLREGLKGFALRLDTANSFAQGLSQVEQNRYDLLLLDYQLGTQSGLQLMRHIRSKGIDTPAIFLTGHGDEEVAVAAMKLGAADYLPKSKLTEDLARKSVRYAIAMHAEESVRRDREEKLQTANRELAGMVNELERRSRESGLLYRLSNALQACANMENAYSLIAEHISELFPDASGGLYMFVPPRNLFEAVATWGQCPPEKREFTRDECSGLREKKPYSTRDSLAGPFCPHLHGTPWKGHICAPLDAYSETLGLLVLQGSETTSNTAAGPPLAEFELQRRFAEALREHLALALANLKLRESLREQAMHDSLTGLFNRRYMEEFLNRALSAASVQQRPLAMLTLDLDHFKDFNDSQGHEAGDEALRSLAQFLRMNTRGEDVACRYGGDEFVLILPDASLAVAAERARQMCASVKQFLPRSDSARRSMPTVSVGISGAPEHGYSAETLLRMADAALYRAKTQGRDRVVLGEYAKSADAGSSAPLS